MGACGSTAFSGANSEDAGSDASSALDGKGGSDALASGDGSLEPSDSGPPGTVRLVHDQDNPHELVARNGKLFWTCYSESTGAGSVNVINADGTGFAKIASGKHANRLAVDDSQVFWTDFVSADTTNSSLNASPLDGGATNSFLTTIVAPMGVATNADSVFFVTTYGLGPAGNITAYTKDGAFLYNIGPNLDSPVSIAADDQGVAWTQQGSTPSSGAVFTQSLDASPGPFLTGLSQAWDVKVSGASAFFTVVGSLDGSAPGAVEKMDRATGDTATFATDSSRAYFIAVDGNNVYWTEEGTGPANGSVRWSGKSDLIPHSLATTQRRPHGIAVDANYIYWASYSGGDIFRAPLPH